MSEEASPPTATAASPPSEAELLSNKTAETSPQNNSTTSQSPPPSSPPPPQPPPPSSPPPSSPPPGSPPPSSPPPSPPPPLSSDSDSPPSKTPSPSPPPPPPPPPTKEGSPPEEFHPPPVPLKGVVSPPPPPPHTTSGSHHHEAAALDSGPSSSSYADVHGVMIAGIVVGSFVIAALCVVIVCLIFMRKKNKKPQYYMDPGALPPKGGEQYYNTPSQWNSPWPHDQNSQLAPPPGYNMGTPMGGGWGAPHSSEYSGGYSSGQHHPTPASPNMGGITQFKYEELASATNGFSQANLLGQGGFGYVHKGILGDKKEVAVKSLKTGSGQGEREFQAEVEIISRVHHRHLVSLVGYCIADQQRLLVYEFVPNKTLEFHLYGKGQPVLDWGTRMRIAVGSAKGLAYLHEDCLPRIIHRDIKAANILLDNNFEAMVADFGLAKLTSDNFTHVSTRVMGTFGYLAPEYASSGKLTEKSDVFSFGVMLLELITGRRPVDTSNRLMEDSLVDWARPIVSKALEDGNFAELVDPRLEGNYNPNEMSQMATCAAASVRHSARRRPKMSQIVRALEGDSLLEDMSDGAKSAQSGACDTYDTRAYDADMLKFKKMVMSSQEFDSSEYGGGTSAEYDKTKP